MAPASDRKTGDADEERPLPPASYRQIVLMMAGIVFASVATIGLAIGFILADRRPARASATPAASVQGDFEKLRGRWLRPDGGYVIELKRLLDRNALEAAYFNPHPIHVAKARLYKENGFVKVFVELQDENYPGSTYTLIYDAEGDRLRGVYYQAVQRQEYSVSFQRLAP